MEKIEGVTEPIVGIAECPSQRVHLFPNVAKMADFVHAFNIQNGTWRSGFTVGGKHVVELTYNSYQG